MVALVVNSRADISELVKHLRKVHFALLLTCVAVLISTIGSVPNEVARAREQLNSILAIRNDWSTWAKKFTFDQISWIKKLGVQSFPSEPEHGYISSNDLDKAKIKHTRGDGWKVILIGAPIYFYLTEKRAQGPTVLHVLSRPNAKLAATDTFGAEISFPGTGSRSEPFNTLSDFAYFWEAAQQPRASFIKAVSPTAYVVKDNKVIAELKVSRDVKPGGGIHLESRRLGGCHQVESATNFRKRISNSFNELFCASIDKGTLVLPARVRDPRVPTNLQRWLISEFKIDTQGGMFPNAFPELDSVTQAYRELDLGKVEQILSAELQRAGERIELLGVRFPENVIATWGTGIMFAVQFFFWLHLRAFWREISMSDAREIPNVGWIGLYRDTWACLISIISVVLPLVVLGVVIYKSDWPLLVSLILLILPLVIGLHSALLIYRVSHLKRRLIAS